MNNIDARYLDGTYESENPDWHEEDAAWKARMAESVLLKNGISPESICDIGCGTGGVLRAISEDLGPFGRAVGFDVSTHAIDVARSQPDAGMTFEVWV